MKYVIARRFVYISFSLLSRVHLTRVDLITLRNTSKSFFEKGCDRAKMINNRKTWQLIIFPLWKPIVERFTIVRCSKLLYFIHRSVLKLVQGHTTKCTKIYLWLVHVYRMCYFKLRPPSSYCYMETDFPLNVVHRTTNK